MNNALHEAAIRAEELRMTRSRSLATGQAPGPPLPLPKQNSSWAGNINHVDPALGGPDPDIDGMDIIAEEDEEASVVDLQHLVDGPLIPSDADDVSWQAPPEKGKGRANSSAPSSEDSASRDPNSRGEDLPAPLQYLPSTILDEHKITPGTHDGIGPCDDPQEALCDLLGGRAGRVAVCPREHDDTLQEPCGGGASKSAMKQTTNHREGKYAEGQALLEHLMALAHGTTSQSHTQATGPVASGSNQPIASGSGIPRPRPRQFIQEDPSWSTDDLSDMPLAKRARQAANLPATNPTTQQPLATQEASVPEYHHQTHHTHPSNSHIRDPVEPPSQQAGSPPSDTTNNDQDLTEEAQVKLLMASKRGRLVLKNGDVVENSRYLVADPSDKMEKGLTPLSPVLTHWLQTFKSYIPLTVFNRIFLLDDQQEWSRRKAPTEAKIDDGAASLRVYGGAPPPEELTMQFEEWIDGMGLFIKYVVAEGWTTLAERFKGHRNVVMELREAYGWMIALRYCRRIRQGVMRETIDNKIKNFSSLQS
ncbi:uncharacterized protein MELLADRAFT_84204 [Melampsora larici-populina 98AG31]|uniref:Uncharacterized protein n=1 Tax=Melampsora larici-populina (strain 98AG31 / pathotype 3-4-7) TaxID=747676 RepID=F4SBY2_MELLP|nr:uncharacterized protein MELLADRAFT_84204 [Melampsora larici-populina 98AG31]EGF97852.1 hypothetical protein MELLADRAFT_84204 [Melampsora larici-populina 98AG31]